MSRLPILMGIMNITPDSFYDGGKLQTIDQALKQAEQMIAEGADWLDIGGESTRPGAQAISEQEELDRVIPIIEAIRTRFDTPVSIDSSKALVMKQALKAGAEFINDVCALTQPGALAVAANATVSICLMHMQGEPATMQLNPRYNGDIIENLKIFFKQRLQACEAAGIARSRLILDPGIGFGKTLAQNLTILNRLAELTIFNLPILIGVSRKAMIGQITNKPVAERLFGSLGATLMAVQNGATLIRTHDVAATAQALRVMLAIRDCASTNFATEKALS